jgi:hypothetical protein
VVMRGGSGRVTLHDPEDVQDPMSTERHLGYSALGGRIRGSTNHGAAVACVLGEASVDDGARDRTCSTPR